MKKWLERSFFMRFITFHSIASKMVLACLLIGTALVFFLAESMAKGFDKTEEEFIKDRLVSDINYIRDLIGPGEWNLKDGGLYLGDKLIGDGTEEHAFLAPFRDHEKKTRTFSYTFVRTGDEGLKYVEKENGMGYQEGHYIRAAGSTRRPDGTSIVGTYIDKKVSDILDSTGEYSGEANVEGNYVFCLYKLLKDEAGNSVGIIVVGRNVSELRENAEIVGGKFLKFIILSVLLACVILIVFLGLWLRSVNRIRMRLAEVADGHLPEQPLRITSRDELGQVTDSINKMVESLREKERLGAELSVATKIQSNMLPKNFPDTENYRLWAYMHPAKEVGGDFYDFFEIGEDRLGIAIGDVSGKGVPAALFMVVAKTIIRDQSMQNISLENVFNHTNWLLCEGNDDNLFVTAWLGILDLKTGMLDYVNAGHNAPVVVQNGAARFLKGRHHFPLAGLPNIKYAHESVQLSEGDKLLLYTDGVTEAVTPSDELYGDYRLLNFAKKNSGMEPKDFVLGLKDNVKNFATGAPQFDDITMLALEFKKQK